MLILERSGTIVMLIMKKVQKYIRQQSKWKRIIKNLWDKILQRNKPIKKVLSKIRKIIKSSLNKKTKRANKMMMEGKMINLIEIMKAKI